MSANKSEGRKKKERKRGTVRKYGQAPLKHAKRGIMSLTIAGTVLFVTLLMIALAYRSGGESGIYTGVLGLAAAVLSCVGIYLGVRGFRERDSRYVTCRFGIGVNIFTLVLLIGIFLRGILS